MAKGLSLVWEILRKAVHLLSPLVIVLAYTFMLKYFSERFAILVLTAFLLAFLEFEYMRVEERSRLALIFEGFFRKHEKNTLSGAVFVIISCIICFSAFDYWVAVLALFMMSFGDIFSSLIGSVWGKTRLFRRKTIVGTLAGFTANFGFGVLILPEFLLLVLPMAVVATFSEMTTNKLDDNLTVPLFAGFVGQMIVYFYNIGLPSYDFLTLFNIS